MSFSRLRKFPCLFDGSLGGILTNTFVHRLKLKRPQTVKMYRDVLDELYAEVEAGFATKAKL
jgi:hypothetical protein